MNEELSFLGLTENEIIIYLALLKNSFSSGTEVRRLTGISNSRVYSALDSLISKGLVNYSVSAKGKIFSSVDPSVLINIVGEKKKKIEALLPQLKQMQGKNDAEKTKSVIYEGFNGFKNAFYKMVEECPKGETIYIIGFSNQAYENENLRVLLSNINTRSIEKRHKFKMILDNKENVFYKDRKVEGISEVRFMEKGFKSPAAIDIFGDSVYIFLWDTSPYAFVIKNKSIAEGFKTYFNFLWNMAYN